MIANMRKMALAVALGVAATLGVAAAEVQIVVPPQADRTVRIAAEAFQQYH